MRISAAGVLAAILTFAGCKHRPPPQPELRAAPHYELGTPYQADGHWYYPAEDYAFDGTGIATTIPPTAAPRLTAALLTVSRPPPLSPSPRLRSPTTRPAIAAGPAQAVAAAAAQAAAHSPGMPHRVRRRGCDEPLGAQT